MGKMILIVDDELEQIDYASAVLEEQGYVPIGATDGIEGMEKVRRERPDLVLLDIMMPEKGGIAMYRELKGDQDTRDIPVVIVTGVTRGQKFEERIMGQEPGVPAPDGYIQKPMKPEALIALVARLLA
jgi:CheY-like chemotaxis protein